MFLCEKFEVQLNSKEVFQRIWVNVVGKDDNFEWEYFKNKMFGGSAASPETSISNSN